MIIAYVCDSCKTVIGNFQPDDGDAYIYPVVYCAKRHEMWRQIFKDEEALKVKTGKTLQEIYSKKVINVSL